MIKKEKVLRILSIRLFHNRTKVFLKSSLGILCCDDVARFEIMSLDMNFVTSLSTKSPNKTT